MKTAAIALLLFAAPALAAPVPRRYTVRSDDPVPKPLDPPPPVVYITPSSTTPTQPSLLAPVRPGHYRNRFRLLGGVGPDGLTLGEGDQNRTTVKPFFGPIMGLGYDRLLWDRISVSIQGLTGASTGTRTYIGTAGIGFDF